VIDDPSIFKLTRKSATLVRVLPTFTFNELENAARRKWNLPRCVCASGTKNCFYESIKREPTVHVFLKRKQSSFFFSSGKRKPKYRPRARGWKRACRLLIEAVPSQHSASSGNIADWRGGTYIVLLSPPLTYSPQLLSTTKRMFAVHREL